MAGVFCLGFVGVEFFVCLGFFRFGAIAMNGGMNTPSPQDQDSGFQCSILAAELQITNVKWQIPCKVMLLKFHPACRQAGVYAGLRQSPIPNYQLIMNN